LERSSNGRAGSGTEIKADAQAWNGQRVVIICFSAPLHLKDEADDRHCRRAAVVAIVVRKAERAGAGGERDGK